MELNLLNKVQEKIDKCYLIHGEYASFAEAMSIFREEFEELWEECKKKKLDFNKINDEITDNLCVLFKMYEDIVVKENRR